MRNSWKIIGAAERRVDYGEKQYTNFYDFVNGDRVKITVEIVEENWGRKMQVKELLDYIQENLNNGRLTPESKVRIRDNWGNDYPANCMRDENNELILADFEM